MNNCQRTKRPEVKSMATRSGITYTLQPDQNFYETRKAWEIWEDDGTPAGLRRLYRIPKVKIVFVFLKSE